MLTIEYGPVHSKLQGDNPKELAMACAVLAHEFTYDMPGAFFMPQYATGIQSGKKAFFNTDSRRFLSGLTSAIAKVLRTAEFDVDITGYPEQRDNLLSLLFGPMTLHDGDNPDITLYDYQQQAVFRSFKYCRGIIKVATNGGKTEVQAYIVKAASFPVSIVLVPRLEILGQTVKRLALRLGPDIKVGVVGGGKWEPNYNGVTVAMFQTVYKRRKQPEVQKWLKGTQITLIDECHMLTDVLYQKVAMACPSAVKIGMTGTLKEDQIATATARGVCGPVLCTIGNKELIDRGISVKPKVVFLEPVVPFVEKRAMEAYSWDYALQNCRYRNQLIANLATGGIKTGRQTVIMVNKVAHGQDILRWIPWATFTHSSASNRKSTRERLASGEVFCCICTSIFDTGLSVDHMELLINAAGGNASHTLLQRLGRLLRQSKVKDKDIWFVDFWDTFNRITRSHSRDRWEILKAEGAFQMQEGANGLPEDMLTEVSEGAGAGNAVVTKSRKLKYKKG